MKRYFLPIAACMLLAASAALAGGGMSGPTGAYMSGFAVTGNAPATSLGFQSPYSDALRSGASYTGLSHKMKQLLLLRDEGLKLRDQDGGTLTPEHHAYLQAKLDAIQSHSDK